MDQLNLILLVEVSIVIVLFFTVLQWRFMVMLRKRIAVLQLQLAEKSEQASAIQAASITAEQMSSAYPYVKVEINDPLAIAEQRAVVGGVVGALVPALVTKHVYQELRKEMAEELRQRGVAARVSVQLHKESS